MSLQRIADRVSGAIRARTTIAKRLPFALRGRTYRPGAPADPRRPSPGQDGRTKPHAAISPTRAAAQATLVVVTWIWHIRSTGSVSPRALAVLAGLIAITMVFGRAFQRCTRSIVEVDPGVAYQALTGFFCANSLLFAMTLASPLGMIGNLVVVGAIAFGLWAWDVTHPCIRSASFETCSFLCIAFCGLAATLWVQEQQPVVQAAGDQLIFTVWTDVFIHARLIAEFAQAHGFGSLANIRFAGGTSPIYHFASYMMPAALNALGQTTAIDSFVALHLPFGILLVGLAAYSLLAVVTRKPWPALVAAIAVVALPDAFEQGFGIRLLAFHFMSQVNLGMLYGIACMAVTWSFMLEGCRTGKLLGVGVAYVFLALCLFYKAHLFLANALVLLLYPGLCFAGLKRSHRALIVVAATAVFAGVVALSQASPRIPTIRVDGTGIVPYLAILVDGMEPGRLKEVFVALYFGHHLPSLVNGALIGCLIALASFGGWLLLVPLVFRRWRGALGARSLLFVAIVVANYLAMSLLLAVDDRHIGSIEELVNRPMAWAYFVLVAFEAAAIYEIIHQRWIGPGRWSHAALLPLAATALLLVDRQSIGLEVAPGWPGMGSYAEFNRVPTCLVRSAAYLRRSARSDEIVLDSALDPHFVVTALSERQAFAVDAQFAGDTPGLDQRIAGVRRLQSGADEVSLRSFAGRNGIGWYVLHPDDSRAWSRQFLERAAFRCGDFRVFRFDP